VKKSAAKKTTSATATFRSTRLCSISQRIARW
jgi:hypothetical protein